MSEDVAVCKTCGLTSEQIPPGWRFVNTSDGSLVCRHPFGIPAQNVPDWSGFSIIGEVKFFKLCDINGQEIKPRKSKGYRKYLRKLKAQPSYRANASS